jgi:GH24 family phage-related lysozyme (muramidase)
MWDDGSMRVINQAGIDLIKSFEGFKPKAYLDMVGVPTLGYGCTVGVTKQNVIDGRTITEQEAEEMLRTELGSHENAVSFYVTVELNDNQFAALVSFAYNLGNGSLHGSTLLKLLNSGDTAGASDEFLKWDRAGGQVVAGLERRRTAEQALFNQPVS